MIDWIFKNKDMIFSGIGVAILGGLVKLFLCLFKHNNTNTVIKQRQNGGNHSNNTQVGQIIKGKADK